MIKESLEKKQQPARICDVTYNSKCFRVIVSSAQNVSFPDAESICKNRNYKNVANIYDFTHYRMMDGRIRSMLGEDSWRGVWTGLRYQNGQLVLTSGKNISFPKEIWYPGYPSSEGKRTNIAFPVRKNPNDEDHGIYNLAPYMEYHGVICEI
uniref:uncharacterized protein LOC120331899 n=1 Tax=Styela clava TaxID=7725 RepID=UPI00193A081A|nr:uncharacterized protein LOC120331899 [Styela clava]